MKNKRKAFWKNFKFKYKLTITNENTLEEIVGIHVSKLNGVSVLLSAVTIIFLITSLIIAFTPLKNYLPGYMNTEVREQVVTNALRADSLQWVLERQRMYIMNIQDIISGTIKADSVQSIDSLTVVRSEELMERTQAEDEFRKQYEETERYNLTTLDNAPAVTGLIFFRPTRGMVSDGKDPFFGNETVLSSHLRRCSSVKHSGRCAILLRNGLPYIYKERTFPFSVSETVTLCFSITVTLPSAF